jgi:hypothetical protein
MSEIFPSYDWTNTPGEEKIIRHDDQGTMNFIRSEVSLGRVVMIEWDKDTDCTLVIIRENDGDFEQEQIVDEDLGDCVVKLKAQRAKKVLYGGENDDKSR